MEKKASDSNAFAFSPLHEADGPINGARRRCAAIKSSPRRLTSRVSAT